ncbi:MAG: uroporphyrinogen-III synthase [Rickettsiales bacterium]
MAKAPLIWLNRPLEDSITFGEELREHGVASLIAPVVHITRKPFTLPEEKPDALLLTSRHAAQALATMPLSWRELPTYCVGSATANAAAELGGHHIIPGPSQVLALLPRMAASLKEGSTLLYLAGEERSVEVGQLLEAHSIYTMTCEVYRAMAEHVLADKIVTAIAANTLTGVAFFSSRSATITCKLLTQAGLSEAARGVEAFCISLNVAQAAAQLPWAALHACHHPTRHAMRELIVSKCLKTL